jgi:hypothetical protein
MQEQWGETFQFENRINPTFTWSVACFSICLSEFKDFVLEATRLQPTARQKFQFNDTPQNRSLTHIPGWTNQRESRTMAVRTVCPLLCRLRAQEK